MAIATRHLPYRRRALRPFLAADALRRYKIRCNWVMFPRKPVVSWLIKARPRPPPA